MALFKFSREKRPRTIVSWFRLGFRFSFRWPFRVSSSTERALAVLQHSDDYKKTWNSKWIIECSPHFNCLTFPSMCTIVSLSVLTAHTAANTLHRTAKHCSILQHTATHSNTVEWHIKGALYAVKRVLCATKRAPCAAKRVLWAIESPMCCRQSQKTLRCPKIEIFGANSFSS